MNTEQKCQVLLFVTEQPIMKGEPSRPMPCRGEGVVKSVGCQRGGKETENRIFSLLLEARR